jgi:multidrug efflux pump subunit AcrA (membrane-fusion protein)
MTPDSLHESLGKADEVRRADRRFERAQKRLQRARRELSSVHRRTLRREEYRGGREIASRGIFEEIETSFRTAEKEVDGARAERRREAARNWEEVRSVLGEEYQRRVKETAAAVAQAVEANEKLRELLRKAEELLPPSEVQRGFLRFDCCWPELNGERFEDWLHFVALAGRLDVDELRKDGSSRGRD